MVALLKKVIDHPANNYKGQGIVLETGKKALRKLIRFNL